jgi:hypothetical protein
VMLDRIIDVDAEGNKVVRSRVFVCLS